MSDSMTLHTSASTDGATKPASGQVYASITFPGRWLLHLGSYMDPVFTTNDGKRTILERDGRESWWPTLVLTLLGREQDGGHAWERFSVALAPLEALSVLPEDVHDDFLDACERLAKTSCAEIGQLPVATAHGHAERRASFLASVAAAQAARKTGAVPPQRSPESFIPAPESVKPDREGKGSCPVPKPFLRELPGEEGVTLGCGLTGHIPWMARDGGGWISESGTYTRPGIFALGREFQPATPQEKGMRISLLAAVAAYPSASRKIMFSAVQALRAAEKSLAEHPLLERRGQKEEIAFARAEIREVRACERGAAAKGTDVLPAPGDVYMTTSAGTALGYFTTLSPNDPIPVWVPTWGKIVSIEGKGTAIVPSSIRAALAPLTAAEREKALASMTQVLAMSRAALARRTLHLPDDPGTELLSSLIRTAARELRSAKQAERRSADLGY